MCWPQTDVLRGEIGTVHLGTESETNAVHMVIIHVCRLLAETGAVQIGKAMMRVGSCLAVLGQKAPSH